MNVHISLQNSAATKETFDWNISMPQMDRKGRETRKKELGKQNKKARADTPKHTRYNYTRHKMKNRADLKFQLQSFSSKCVKTFLKLHF